MADAADEHPDLREVAGGMRAEWRAEQEAAAADAAAQWRHGRTLVDWLRDRMHAGDHIAVTVGPRTFTGTIDEVGDDLVTLRDRDGRVEVHLGALVPLSFGIGEHATSGGSRATNRRSFRDALVARDARPDLRVGTVDRPDGVDCTLLVSRDFVTLVTPGGDERAVPIAGVAWVRAVGSGG